MLTNGKSIINKDAASSGQGMEHHNNGEHPNSNPKDGTTGLLVTARSLQYLDPKRYGVCTEVIHEDEDHSEAAGRPTVRGDTMISMGLHL